MAEANANCPDDFERGLQLFNAGQFFAAHEVWELVWKRSVGVERILLQALIQAAAALLHVERGNPRGAASVWAKARTRFKSLPANLLDLDLQNFRAAVEAVINTAGHEAQARAPQLRRVGATPS